MGCPASSDNPCDSGLKETSKAGVRNSEIKGGKNTNRGEEIRENMLILEYWASG